MILSLRRFSLAFSAIKYVPRPVAGNEEIYQGQEQQMAVSIHQDQDQPRMVSSHLVREAITAGQIGPVK